MSNLYTLRESEFYAWQVARLVVASENEVDLLAIEAEPS